jgi:hypothetical protein
MRPQSRKPEEDDDETSISEHIGIIFFLIASRATEFVLRLWSGLRKFSFKSRRSSSGGQIDGDAQEGSGDNVVDISSRQRPQPPQGD